MSYSWDIGDIHFVQLHNHPYYKTTWSRWNHPKALRNYYFIEPSIDWLRKDLALAAKKKKKIIINLHDHQRTMINKEFLKILKDYKVSALFAGHLHSLVGQVKFPSACNDPSIGVPCFLSGGAAYRSVLAVRFKEGRNMLVEAYRGKQHPPKLDPPYVESTKFFEIKLRESKLP